MKTQLLEFPNRDNQLLRGILSLPEGTIEKVLVCLHGFERNATAEKKFKALSDSLTAKKVAVLRFDFTGCGLSDGDFRTTTIETQADDFLKGIAKLKNEINFPNINVIAHSLGSCVLATTIEKLAESLEKIVLIAPALNQRDLLRYWFVVTQIYKTKPAKKINWQNYRQYLDEEAFQKDSQRTDRMTKANYLDPKYFLDAKNLDFSEKYQSINTKVLHVHGSKDIAVPLESLNITFDHQIIIEDGDHELEKPTHLAQWTDKAIDFILN